MMKIYEFRELYSLPRSRLADCLDIERYDHEDDKAYRKRRTELLRRREGLDWEMMYVDGVVIMRNPRGMKDEIEAPDLNDFISIP